MNEQTKLDIAAEALRNISVQDCENFTSGLFSCFKDGRTVNAQYGADKVCNSCIAEKALNEMGLNAVPTK